MQYLARILYAVCLSTPALYSAAPPPVPAIYRDLYTELDTYLTNFQATLGAASPMSFYGLHTASLLQADANAGAQLINPGYWEGVELQLQALKAGGVQGVAVEIGFPMLYQPFLQSVKQNQSEYVAFYANVAAAVRAMGLKLIVENDIMLTDSNAGAPWNSLAYLSAMSWTQYQQARSETAALIAETMQPDYLVLVQEPDTEATNSGQSSAQTPSGSVSLLSQMIAAVGPSGVSGIKLGAGVGTWQSDFQDYIQGYVSQPIDFVDMHIYQVNLMNLPNAVIIAGIASAAGLPLSMSECWLFKSSDSELGVLSRILLRSRRVFSFWEPLDVLFLQTMEEFASSTRMAFLNPFTSYCFWAYLDYSKTLAATPPDQLLDMEHKAANKANQHAVFSSTGIAYYQSIVSPPDTAPPSTPGGVSGVSRDPTTSLVSWTASTDNVGVAGYRVSRDGAAIGNTAHTFFQDSGLSQATAYTYTVQAFDLAGNLSPASLPASVTTKDVTPPSTPTNLTAEAVSSNRVVLSWTAATDNEGVRSYVVFRGTSPASLTQLLIILSPKTTCNSGGLIPGTTYYYGVEAKDLSGNVSPMSAVIAVTTPALPSAPANLNATAVSSVKIHLSWAASTGSLPIAYYFVCRGTSPDALVQVAIPNGAKTSFEDTSVLPATTYYYAVQAADTDHDRSLQSAVAKATTP